MQLRLFSGKTVKNKLKFILWLAFPLIAIGLYFGIKNIQAADLTLAPSTPTVKVIVKPLATNAAGVMVTWSVPDYSDYGYKVEKEGVNGREIAVLLDPEELGDANLSKDGFYFDPAVILGDTYTYFVTSFDRAGEESPAASATVKVELTNNEGFACTIEFSSLDGTAGEAGVSLTWTKLCADTTYKIFRDNQLIGETKENTYIDKSVTVGEHEYKVEAYQEESTSRNIFIDKAFAAPKMVGSKTTKVQVTSAPAATGAVTSSGMEVGVAIPGSGNKFASYTAYIAAVFKFSLQLGIVLTTLMIIYAGYKYMTSQGNPTALNEAKDIIVGSLSGFAMLVLIYLILNVFNLYKP